MISDLNLPSFPDVHSLAAVAGAFERLDAEASLIAARFAQLPELTQSVGLGNDAGVRMLAEQSTDVAEIAGRVSRTAQQMAAEVRAMVKTLAALEHDAESIRARASVNQVGDPEAGHDGSRVLADAEMLADQHRLMMEQFALQLSALSEQLFG